MEVYVDDMIVKSRTDRQLVPDLREILNILWESRIRLNTKKCTFGVRSGKLLGFLVSQEGIRANPDKFQAIMNMAPPEERQRASEQGEILFLYLSACNETVSAVLVRENRGARRPIYYVSCALQGPETRYTPAEKLVLALVHAARKLRPYFQTNSITVLTDQPLRQILTKPEISGRMTKWTVELAEHDIGYQSRTAIKAQALADFLIEGASLSVTESSSLPEEAEYEALLTGLRIAHQMDITAIRIRSDSQLVICQIERVPRSQNKRTDAVSKLASSSFAHLSKEVLVEVVKQKSIGQIQVLAIDSSATWMTLLVDFLTSGALPVNKTETRRLQLRTAKYAYAGGTLYRRSYLFPWLKYITPEEGDYVFREV
nr:uncharacterized protein LOC113728959 [Coffea arabica]